MPSLRKKVTNYFRQLSFHNEPRRNRSENLNDNCFITKYLSGENVRPNAKEAPIILHGKELKDLPCYELGSFSTGSVSVVSSYTGPKGGLTTVSKTQKHLSIADPEIDFIDTLEEQNEPKKEEPKQPQRQSYQPIDNTTMRIKVGGCEFNVTTIQKKRHSQSLNSLADAVEFYTVKSFDNENTKNLNNSENNNSVVAIPNITIINKVDVKVNGDNCTTKNLNNTADVPPKIHKTRFKIDESTQSSNKSKNTSLKKSKSEGDPFKHERSSKKLGKIISYTDRSFLNDDEKQVESASSSEKVAGISNWKNPTEFSYGMSDTLYEKNPITNKNNGDPIADCFGIIARNDSAILALADGVNWGLKASIAAKSAIHGCLNYLNNTVFSDNSEHCQVFVKTSEKLQNLSSRTQSSKPHTSTSTSKVTSVKKLRTAESLLESSLKATRSKESLNKHPIKPARTKKASGSTSKTQQSKTVHSETVAKIPSPQPKPRVHQRRPSRCSLTDIDTEQDPCEERMQELSQNALEENIVNNNRIVNTEEVFVSLLRSFYEAHNLILENEGMLTTLTVAIVLPLKYQRRPPERNTTVKIETNQSNDLHSLFLSDRLSNHERHEEKKVNERTKSVEHKVDKQRSVELRHKVGQKPPEGSRKSNVSQHSHRATSENLPRRNTVDDTKRFICCVCNLGDSLAYVYSKKYGVRELTQGSHDVYTMRDMRDALGALGPVDGTNPELNNLTLSMSIVEQGDIIFITSDGVSDNFDPVVGRFAVLPPPPNESQTSSPARQRPTTRTQRPAAQTRPTYMRSNTVLAENQNPSGRNEIQRSKDGLPIVKAYQRHELTLLRMEDLLNKGISGYEQKCSSAQQLCQLLIDWSTRITAAKRHFLEEPELYYCEQGGTRAELSNKEQKLRRRSCLERISNMPGKLDHASVVAYVVGSCIPVVKSSENRRSVLETNF